MRKLALCLIGLLTVTAAAGQRSGAKGEQAPAAKKSAAASKQTKRKTPFGEVNVPQQASSAGQQGAASSSAGRQTPFGKVNAPEQVSVAETQIEALEGVSVFEEGDSVRFERRTPFGLARWMRKKAELSPEEQAAWERARKPGQKQKAESPRQEQ